MRRKGCSSRTHLKFKDMVADRVDNKPPIHVHVARDTPVHVHVKKPKRKNLGSHGVPKSVEQRITEKHGATTKLMRSGTMGTGIQKNKAMRVSQGPARVSSIPPPTQATRHKPMTWEGKKHRLEIMKPGDKEPRRTLQISDLSDSEGDDAGDSLVAYEAHINELVDEVGTLRNEVDLQKSTRVHQKKEEQLDASRQVIEDQENEIEEVKSELNNTMKENELLRQSFGKLKGEMEVTKSEAENLGNEKMSLLKKLVEAEQDSKAAAVEISKLRKSVRTLKEDQQLTVNEAKQLEIQREDLMQRLQDFETTNRNLRKMLRDAHRKAEAEDIIADERDALATKLAETERKWRDCEVSLRDRDAQIETLIAQVEADKEQMRNAEEAQKTLDSTRAHLQGQLRNREQENSRLMIRNRTVEDELRKQVLELEHVQGLLAATREKTARDKDGLKKATRIQKERAIKSEEALEALNYQLVEKEREFEDLRLAHETVKEKYNKVYREKLGLDTDLASYRGQIQEIKAVLSSLEKGKGITLENIPHKIGDLMQEVKLARVETDRARNDVRASEERIRSIEKAATTKASQAQLEKDTLQSAVDQYQGLIAEYKAQVEQYKKENDELTAKLHQKEKELTRELGSSSREMEKMRNSLQSRLSELEPYPELLKASEARLSDVQTKVVTYEERAADHTRLIAELTQKIESQSDHIGRLKEKYRDKQDELKSARSRFDAMERKLGDLEIQNRELMSIVAKRDESSRLMQDRIEDQRHENNRLIQQLEVALADAKKQAEQQREKAITKERVAHARISDLESQLARSTATAQQLRRAKEETERKSNTRLQDMRDRLEQATNTTRSMQNYVNFLKTSYSSVFKDTDDPIGLTY